MYVNKDIKQTLQKVEHWTEDKEQGVKTIIGADFTLKQEERVERWLREMRWKKGQRRK